ncbi:MAG: neutral/alkaline non-lysosomal ceramidase N-terminal domain-containing protein [Candidatus Rokubacteria bacterium]|nr:neutral/alkaline non-lysosomal ceramidase N-terminal domain-containing protein [Candidatus Rokubacteria bacterium]
MAPARGPAPSSVVAPARGPAPSKIAPAREPAPSKDPALSIGIASVLLEVPPGTPLGGYGSPSRRLFVPDLFGRTPHAFWLRPHEGQLDPLTARAVVLERGDVRVFWVAADLVAVDRAFTAEVRRLLAEDVAPGTLIISASHTHSGPGSFMDSGLLGAVSIDRYDVAVRDALATRVADAVRRADAVKQPGRIGVARVTAPALTSGRLGHPVDREIVVINLTTASGAPLAVVWNYAIHGTMLGPKNLRLSADVMGAANAELERTLGLPALFVNGAVGDVSPDRHGLPETQAAGRELAAAVAEGWTRAEPSRVTTLAVRTTQIELPAPRVSLHNCLASWLPVRLTLPLGWALPRDAELIGVALGPVAFVTVPGELQSRLGRAIKDAARSEGRDAFVAGVSNDYLGYFVTPEDYQRTAYATCASLYGADAGEALTRAAMDLVRELPR